MSTPHRPTDPPTQSDGIPPAPAPGPLRRRIEQASRPALERLARLPVWAPFLILLLLILVGGFLGGPVGWALVGVAFIFILWLLYLSWPRLRTAERVMRLAVLAVFLAVTITQLIPRA